MLRGFQLTDAGYRELEPHATEEGIQLTSDALGLLLQAEDGQLHLTDASTGERLLPPPDLAAALRASERRAEAAEARAEALAAELERLRADQDSS
jgi:hypothetical protein